MPADWLLPSADFSDERPLDSLISPGVRSLQELSPEEVLSGDVVLPEELIFPYELSILEGSSTELVLVEGRVSVELADEESSFPALVPGC